MKDRPLHFGRKQKPPAICECDHLLGSHADKELDSAQPCQVILLSPSRPSSNDAPQGLCPCTVYRRKGSVRKGTKRSIVKHAKAAERKGADYVEGFRIPSTGKASLPDAVALGPDGGELLAVEVKHRRITKSRKDAMRQAMHAARGRRGAPIPCLIEIDKPGLGKQDGMDLISFLAEDWRKIAERLEGTDG